MQIFLLLFGAKNIKREISIYFLIDDRKKCANILVASH